jgi:hypothetical protein
MEYYGGVEQWLAKKTKMKKIEEVSSIQKVPGNNICSNNKKN